MRLVDMVVEELENSLTLKRWTIAYRNSLPDTAFAVIEPAYIRGETGDKRCRHLAIRDHTGKYDENHLRNALARVNQIKPITKSITTAELRRQAMETLAEAKKDMGWD